MAYRAYINGNLFFSTLSADTSLKLSTAELALTAGQAGTFTFTVPPDNVAYQTFTKFKSYIDVYRDEDLIFSGRVLEDGKTFTTEQSIVAEGMLAVLNDSVFRPATYNVTLQELVQTIITSHNNQVEAAKQLSIGTITVTDEYVYRAYEEIASSWSRLQDLVDSYGGYMSVFKNGNTLTFNWFEEPEETNSQHIDFGSNILDITQSSSGAELITVLIPQGAEMEDPNTGNRSRVDITSVNNGNDYIEASSSVLNEFGRIVGVMTWDDVTEPSNLKTKAQAYLNRIAQNRVSISLSVVDLADAGEDFSHFTIGQKVFVTSTPHGITNEPFIVRERQINLLDPSVNRMTLGETKAGYVGKTQNAIAANVNRIDRIIANYATNESVRSITSEYQSIIEQTSDSIDLVVQRVDSIDGENGSIAALSTRVNQTERAVNTFISENGDVLIYFTYDASGLWIGRPEDPIKLLESNNAIQFIDQSGNVVLLEINPSGVYAPSVAVDEQVAFQTNDVDEWAIRKGSIVNSKHNLDIVYLG